MSGFLGLLSLLVIALLVVAPAVAASGGSGQPQPIVLRVYTDYV